MHLVLHSPVGGSSVVYQWPFTSGSGNDRPNSSTGIIETIKWVCRDIPDLKIPLESNILKKYNAEDYASMKILCDKFNRVVDSVVAMCKGTTVIKMNARPSRALLKHILQQVYNECVDDPELLNQYEPFSPEVYGETSFDLICDMVDQINIEEDDIFLDLGSGVGQIVLQMAALAKCKTCIGIEKEVIRSVFAERMDVSFKKWMSYFGKSYGNYELIQGDFLKDEFLETIHSSSIVFVNNFAFGPKVDHLLKLRFAELKDGTRIVSSRSFCPLNFRMTDRNLSDIGTIMHVSEIKTLEGSVSWTGKPVSFYLHVIDRTKLERYFQKLKKEKDNGFVESEDSEKASVASKESEEDPKKDKKKTEKVKGKTRRKKKDEDWSSNEEFEARVTRKSVPKKNDQIGLPPKKKKRMRSPVSENSSASEAESFEEVKKPPKKKRPQRKAKPEPSDDEEEVPLSLIALLDTYKDQYLDMLKKMKSSQFKKMVVLQIQAEKKKNAELVWRSKTLEKQVGDLLKTGVTRLKDRISDLGISANTAEEFLIHFHEAVERQSELSAKVAKLEAQVEVLELQGQRTSGRACES